MSFKKSVLTVLLAAGTACGFYSLESQAQTSAGGQRSMQPPGGDMVTRVREALHSDPALLDKNIDLSMKDGKVVMNGFVRSADDMQKAVRTANKTAGKKNVVNNLTIKEGGDGGSG